MAASSRSARLLLGLLIPVVPAAAQTPAIVTGRVVRFAGPDTLAIPNAMVVLHQIGDSTQGPIDSLATDRGGRFTFRFVSDSSTLYLLSASHHGIAYFSSPVAREPGSRVDDILLIVSDTSSVAPVRIAARSLILGAAEASGDRPVVEVIEFANRGRETRVAADSVPTLAVPMARGGQGFTIEDSDLSPNALLLRGDSLLIFAPMAPGGRMVILQYRLPAGTRRLELPGGLPVDTMQVLLEPGGIELTAALPQAGDQVIEGRTYQRWMGAWPADSTLAIVVTGVTFTQTTALGVLLGVLAVAVTAGLVWTRRRRQPMPGEGVAPETAAARGGAELVDALARLDARYAGQRARTDPAEWRRYETERARLKAQLAQALARTAPAP